MKRLFALALACLMLLSACGGDQSAESGGGDGGPATYKDTLTWAQAADVTSLDPHVGKESCAVTVNTQIFSTLMRVTGDGDPQPSLAESYQQLDDTSWEFTIRQGVKFHDGTEMTLEDVKYSLDRAVASSYVNYVVSFIESVEITGDNTIVIHTVEPYVPILNNLSIPFTAIVPKAYIEEHGDEYFAQHPIGTGPYKMVEWNPGESIKLEAFDEYFGGTPKTKNLVMKVIPEAAQRVIAMETGEADIAYSITANDVSKIEENPDLVAVTRPSRTCYNFYFNLKNGPTADPNVRKAISYAIDRDLIIEAVLAGRATPATSIISPTVVGYVEGLPEYEYDLEKAKELMAQSDYPDGCNLTMVVNDNQERIEICQVVQDMLKELNITVEIKSYEQATYIQALNNGEHNLGFSAWITSTGDADYTYYPLFYSTSPSRAGNRAFFADSRADPLILAGRGETDPEKRIEIYRELEGVIYDVCSNLYICHPLDVVALNSKVEGFVANNDGYHQLENVMVRE